MLDLDVPGHGEWCSNSKSPAFKKRRGKYETCSQFVLRGSVAPANVQRLLKNVQMMQNIANKFKKKGK